MLLQKRVRSPHHISWRGVASYSPKVRGPATSQRNIPHLSHCIAQLSRSHSHRPRRFIDYQSPPQLEGMFLTVPRRVWVSKIPFNQSKLSLVGGFGLQFLSTYLPSLFSGVVHRRRGSGQSCFVVSQSWICGCSSVPVFGNRPPLRTCACRAISLPFFSTRTLS
jgi:hypothetical protein